MNQIQRIIHKLSLLFGRARFHSELDEEMAFHRAQVEKELVADGMEAGQARMAAARQFGNATLLREQSHGVVAFRAETVLQDLHYAFRQLRQNPGFALTAILILALGMGVSVAIFGFVDAALLQPLPFETPNRLMSVDERSAVHPRSNLSREDYEDWKRLNKSFSSIEVYTGMGYLLRYAVGGGADPCGACERWVFQDAGREAGIGA